MDFDIEAIPTMYGSNTQRGCSQFVAALTDNWYRVKLPCTIFVCFTQFVIITAGVCARRGKA